MIFSVIIYWYFTHGYVLCFDYVNVFIHLHGNREHRNSQWKRITECFFFHNNHNHYVTKHINFNSKIYLFVQNGNINISLTWIIFSIHFQFFYLPNRSGFEFCSIHHDSVKDEKANLVYVGELNRIQILICLNQVNAMNIWYDQVNISTHFQYFQAKAYSYCLRFQF